MPMNVLITGGAGYIGSVHAPVLLREGYGVHVLDNFRFDQTSLTDCCLDPNFTVTRGDCREKDTLTRPSRRRRDHSTCGNRRRAGVRPDCGRQHEPRRDQPPALTAIERAARDSAEHEQR